MKILARRNTNKLIGKANEVKLTKEDYLVKLVRLYSASSVDRDNWLTKREEQFFIALVIIENKKIKSHKSDEASEIYNKLFGKHRKSARDTYMKKLEDKFWIRRLNGRIEVPPLFTGIDLSSDIFNLNITIGIDEYDDRQDLVKADLPNFHERD